MNFKTLYSSPTIIWATKSRKVEWAGHVAYAGEKRNAWTILVGKHEGDYLEVLAVDERIILKRILKNRIRMWTGFISIRTSFSRRTLPLGFTYVSLGYVCRTQYCTMLRCKEKDAKCTATCILMAT